MPSFKVDGNDFFAVYDTVLKAKEHALAGKGPVLIEAMTYRMGPHSTSDDPSRYRKEEEVEKWRSKCPVLRLRKILEEKKLWNNTIEEAWKAQITKEIDEAITTAQATPKPDKESLIENVYFEVPEKLKKQLDAV
jgi:2-oxoisovalerate dehydrogenase E1 component alpha subunit